MMPKEMKSASELEALILDALRAVGIDAASIEVYALDEPNVAMSWTVRRLRLNKASEIKVEGALKKIVFPLVERYDLEASNRAAKAQGA